MENPRTGPSRTLYCSFCFKSQHEVTELISGPAAIFICSECVEFCDDFIHGHRTPAAPPPPEVLANEVVLQRLAAVELTLVAKGAQLKSLVETLRSRHISWADIGSALGISRQAAWERFS